MDIPTFFVAGAAAFCAQHPTHVACQPAPSMMERIEPVALTPERAAFITELARRMHEDPTAQLEPELFRVVALARNDYRGDCASQALWALGQLTADPELLAATHPVVYFQQEDGTSAHLALLVWTDKQAVIVDGRDGRTQPFTHEEMLSKLERLYASTDGVAGEWRPVMSN